jgi:hypothetical protein
MSEVPLYRMHMNRKLIIADLCTGKVATSNVHDLGNSVCSDSHVTEKHLVGHHHHQRSTRSFRGFVGIWTLRAPKEARS